MSGAIKGRPTSKKIQSPTNDLRETDNFVTVVPIGSSRHAIDTVPMGVFAVHDSVLVGAGSTDEIVEYTAHTARVGDFVRIEISANGIQEFEVSVKEIIDANNLRLAAILSASLAAGDTISILRPLMQRFSSDGTTLASISSSPVQFIKDGVSTEVEEDTAVPANNNPLPVKLVGLTGDVNITADNLNVQLSHTGANPDSVQLGDGTNVAAINASNELATNDADANTSLLLIAADADALAQTVATVGAAIRTTGAQLLGSDGTLAKAVLTNAAGNLVVEVAANALPSGAATEATLADVEALLTTIDIDTGNIAARLPAALGQTSEAASLSVTLSTENETDLAGIRTAVETLDNIVATHGAAHSATGAQILGTDGTNATRIKTNAGGELEVAITATVLPTGAATEATLDEISVAAGAPADTAVTNPASSASIIAALKGLLSYQADYPVLDSTQTQTVGGSVVAFTAPAGARSMIIQNSLNANGAVRFRAAAETPTASNGFYLGVGQSTSLMPAGTFGAIEVGASETGDVTVIWFT